MAPQATDPTETDPTESDVTESDVTESDVTEARTGRAASAQAETRRIVAERTSAEPVKPPVKPPAAAPAAGPAAGPAAAPAAAPAAVRDVDGILRCPWATTHPLNRYYHDTEWGRTVHGEQALLERICLEGFQAGLSWLTILNKRPAFRSAFANFVPETLAEYGPEDVERLLSDQGIVRNRAKIQAAVTNARATLALREQGGLDQLLWSHQPRGPLPGELPSSSPESKRLSRTLRAHGFAFVGPTTAQALMEAVGMVNGHVSGCHRYDQT